MMNESFADLPDALVRDLLNHAAPLAGKVSSDFSDLLAFQKDLKNAACEKRLVRKKADLEVTREPSVVGVDGSYQVHRLTSVDLCAAAAVAVEGTSKEARRHWQEPYHKFWADAVSHYADTTGALRGLMVCMELELAHNAPHDLVLLDGSFASLIIYLNQGLSSTSNVETIKRELTQRWQTQDVLQRLIEMLSSDSAVALPKYTSRNELAKALSIKDMPACDGRTMATLILEPGEYTKPLPIYHNETYHLPCPTDEMNNALSGVQVIYFRPYGWVPALRMEVPGPIARSPTRLSLALKGIEGQFFVPAVKEPYPLFLADRMVKSLGAGVAVMEQTILQDVIDSSVEVELPMLLLQNYRTESGRGGV